MSEPHLILGLGELLWDLLPEGPRLGGAPANFSVMAGRLGNHAAILSRVGRDELGRQALWELEQLDRMPADASFVQVDPEHETGRVTVAFEGGQPSYTIHEPVAWDFLELSDEWVQLAERADAICFGTLAQRHERSREAIQTLVGLTQEKCVRVFDVNLRAPFYSGEILQESIELATVVKMNDAEMPLALGLMGLDCQADPEAIWGVDALRAGAASLLKEFPTLGMVAVTRGGEGSLLMTREDRHEHPGIATKVADTIGAGDAFTAAMTHYLLRGASLSTLNEAGNRWGSWVASQAGAMPVLPAAVQAQIAEAIEG
ncbi:MAG: carbohydrate kinase [Terracidiphilus sp.]